jgi:8-oxo-dGTP diphosphatase
MILNHDRRDHSVHIIRNPPTPASTFQTGDTVRMDRQAEVAVGLIVADDGRLLLQHRDDRPGIPAPGRWGFFGGHVEPGERPADAFLREMREELGWTPQHFEAYLRREISPFDAGRAPGTTVTSHVFAAHLDVPVTELVLGEGQAMALHAADALPDTVANGIVPVIDGFVTSDAYKRVRRRWDIITATAILVDAGGSYLLQHRDDKRGIDNPGMWGSFGGRIEPYESAEDGFLRELEEELAWQPESFELYGSAPYRVDERRQLIYLYAAPVSVPIGDMVLGEGQGFGFFPPDALPPDTQPDYAGLLARFTQSDMYVEMIRRAAEGD